MNHCPLYRKFLFLYICCTIQACIPCEKADTVQSLNAKHYFSGFELANHTYNAISAVSDGKIYYVLSSKSIDEGGKIYIYDPVNDHTNFLADLTEICGKKNLNTVPQGKSHVKFYEKDHKLYFSTHGGYYEIIEGMERVPVNLPEKYKGYPGGHFLTYNLKTGVFEDLAIAPYKEGIVTVSMDTTRMQIYAITWPFGYFIHYNLLTNSIKNLGKISSNGEAGVPGEDYRVLCRTMLINPDNGQVYFSTGDGDIFVYNPDEGFIHKLEDVNLRLDYFGRYDPSRPGSMSYNWRSIFWYSPEKVAYGVHGNSGYLFKFDPEIPQIELVDRITSEPSKRSGMNDQFSYGYLGFELGPDGETIYYLTGGPIYKDGKRVKGELEIGLGGARGLENLHLITYNIPGKKYTDHGTIFLEDGQRPTWVNSIAIGPDGYIYTLARFKYNGLDIEDLIKIPDPLKKDKRN